MKTHLTICGTPFGRLLSFVLFICYCSAVDATDWSWTIDQQKNEPSGTQPPSPLTQTNDATRVTWHVADSVSATSSGIYDPKDDTSGLAWAYRATSHGPVGHLSLYRLVSELDGRLYAWGRRYERWWIGFPDSTLGFYETVEVPAFLRGNAYAVVDYSLQVLTDNKEVLSHPYSLTLHSDTGTRPDTATGDDHSWDSESQRFFSPIEVLLVAPAHQTFTLTGYLRLQAATYNDSEAFTGTTLTFSLTRGLDVSAFSEAAYISFLGRFPDSAEVQASGETLTQRHPPSWVRDQLVDSPAAKLRISDAAFVRRLYENYFQRKPNGGEEQAHLPFLAAGGSRAELRDFAFIDERGHDNRPSNDDFVRECYRQILFREPDDAGFQYWRWILNTGAKTRSQVRDDFFDGIEFEQTELADKTLRQLAGVFDFSGWPRNLGGDLDGDFRVDATDYQLFRASLGKMHGDPGYHADADYDGDQRITYADYRIWYQLYTSYIAQYPDT